MSAAVELVSVMTDEEAEEITRNDIVALLSLDAHHWFAQKLGQALLEIAGRR